MEENRTVLIVDDESETLKGYESFLAQSASGAQRKSSRRASSDAPSPSASPTESYRLLLAKSGEEAVAAVKAEMEAGGRVAAGFFDVKLEGGMDGLQTIQAIKKLDKDLRCVVVTAYQDRSVEEIHQLFGEEFKDHWDYLNKPFTQGEIVQKARQMVSAWNKQVKLELLNTQLVKSERLAGIGQVARGVGHEFGNILLRVIGKIDLALMEDDVAKIRAHLEVAMKAVERAGVIVRNLQSFSKSQPNLAKAELTQPIEEALSLVAHEFVKYSVKLTKNFKCKETIRIDSGALAQVFLNLFINATHAMPSGGTLSITVEDAPGPNAQPGVVARVADSGAGIAPGVLPKIFDFAFTTKGDGGSGLGLSISKEIVEAHGGQITVKTEQGKGTEFSVWLPKQGK